MASAPHAFTEEPEATGRSYDWRLLLKFVRFVRPVAGLTAVAAVLSIGSAFLELVGPHIVQRILDGPAKTGELAGVNRLIVLWMGVVAVTFVFNVAIRLLVTWTSQSAMLAMRHEIFSHLQRLDTRFFDRNRVGRLLTRVMSDVSTFNELFSMGIPTFFRDLLVLVGIVIALFATDWRLAAVVFICFPFLAAATWLFGRAIRVFYRQTRTRLAALNAFLQENLSGLVTVQLFGREAKNHARFCELNGRLRGYSPLSRVVELEALALGVHGKLAMWRSLEALEPTLSLPAVIVLPELAARAERQLEELETHRLRAVADALSSTEPA